MTQQSSHKIKLLFVVPWFGRGLAGAEQQTVMLLKTLDLEVYDIRLVAITHDRTMVENEIESMGIVMPIDIVEAERIRHARGMLNQITQMYQPDVVVANVLNVCVIAAINKIVSRGRYKLLSINHGADYRQWSQRIQSVVVGWVSDGVVCVSEGTRQAMQKYMGTSRNITVIPNGFDIVDIQRQGQSAGRCEHEIDPEPHIVFVGRLDNNQKGLDTLVKAVSYAVNQLDIYIKGTIVGDGEDRELLERLIQDHQVEQNISMVGWCHNPYWHLVHAKTMVLSSNFEGFGRVLVEAMALGVPVVSTDCPSGPREILQDGTWGTLVPVGDYQALAKALVEAYRSPLVDAHLLQKRASDFSMQKIGHQYHDMIQSIMHS